MKLTDRIFKANARQGLIETFAEKTPAPTLVLRYYDYSGGRLYELSRGFFNARLIFSHYVPWSMT